MLHAQHRRLRIMTGTAFSQHDFSWSIAGNMQGTSPNVLSELKHANIRALGAYVKTSYALLKLLEIEGEYQRYSVLAGRVTDRDFYGDNRTVMVYDESFDSNKGYLEVKQMAVFVKPLSNEGYLLKIGPMYIDRSQKYYMRSPQIAQLNTTYHSRWKGLGFAAGGEGKLSPVLKYDALAYYCFVTYSAVADWNMKKEFEHPVSFIQQAKGFVLQAELTLRYKLTRSCWLTLQGIVGRSKTRRGEDIAYFSNGTQGATQLNAAQRNDVGIKLGVAIEL
jgi:hypothetical protein